MNLSFGQRIKRRIWLTFASHYRHPDGTLELDFDEKAGIDVTRDSEEVQNRKFDTWNKRQGANNLWGQGFLVGVLCGAAAVYWWPW